MFFFYIEYPNVFNQSINKYISESSTNPIINRRCTEKNNRVEGTENVQSFVTSDEVELDQTDPYRMPLFCHHRVINCRIVAGSTTNRFTVDILLPSDVGSGNILPEVLENVYTEA